MICSLKCSLIHLKRRVCPFDCKEKEEILKFDFSQGHLRLTQNLFKKSRKGRLEGGDLQYSYELIKLSRFRYAKT